jgi:hypothetical protein
MKATVVTIALLLAGAAYAQTPPSPPAPNAAQAARHMDDLATLLDLTEAQKAYMQTTLQAQHAQMKASFEQARASGTKPDWEQMKALHEQLQQQTLQKLSTGPAALSATQLKKFQIIQQSMHAHMGHHMGHGQAGATAPAPTQN